MIARPAADADESPQGSASESGIHVRSSIAPATVLVADDDPYARSAIGQILAEDGYAVVEAGDGAHTLELLSRAADERGALPDVVLLDFVMPGFSGIGILRVMRRFERMPPTIIMTGFADPSVETFARNLGALRVLRKPIDEDDLRDAVLEAAAQRTSFTSTRP